jgi:MFS transporter, DHA1 family, multidrug resistance protein
MTEFATQNQQPTTSTHTPLGFREFVALAAAAMAMIAMSIDLMLPALPEIGESLGVANPNHRQWIIGIFLLGLSLGSLISGTLSDAYGRRRVLMGATALAVVMSLICFFAKGFTLLLLARFVAGLVTSACRVVTVSIIRDCYKGDMARILSLCMMIFLIVPMVAPSLGELIMMLAPWRAIFGALALLGVILLLWIAIRLPETLQPTNRVPFDLADIVPTFHGIVAHRNAMAYIVASGLVMGAQTGFLLSIQQIIFDVFGARSQFSQIFAFMVLWMGVGSLFNSRLVRKFGARPLSHIAMCALVLLALTHVGMTAAGLETLTVFIVLQSAIMICMSFAGANFGAISMEPFAHGAGQAASVQSFISSLLATSIGSLIGATMNGTTLPLASGFLVCGLCALALVLWGERGRLFQRAAAPE